MFNKTIITELTLKINPSPNHNNNNIKYNACFLKVIV